MGADKALVELGGKPMVSWVAAALESAECEPLVIGRTTVPLEIPSEPDDVPGRAGPAAGLATALRLADGRDVFLAATDQPFLRSDTIRALCDYDAVAVVPLDDGRLQTTSALYRAGCLDRLREVMADDPSVSLRALVDAVATRVIRPEEWRTWGEDGRSWWSIDTPAEVKKAERWLEKHRESSVARRDIDGNRDPE